MTEFQPFPKIARLNRDIIVTEKIDGSNGALVIEDGELVAVQSRNRFLTPGKSSDNFGFAGWAYANAEALASVLGDGRHYGEWWGKGIQRGYGLTDRVFSLFNVHRWADADLSAVPELFVVPKLYEGAFSQGAIGYAIDMLADIGSFAAPGFPDPEGVVVFHTAARQMFKVTVKDDEKPKGQVQV